MKPENNTDIPDTLTQENYQSQKSDLRSSIIFSIIVGILISVFPLILAWVKFSEYDGNDWVDLIITLLFVGGGLAAFGVIWYVAIGSIVSSCKRLKMLNRDYLKTLSEDELSSFRKNKRRQVIILSSAFGLLLTGLITGLTIHSVKLSNAYDNAVSVAFSGSYEEAKTLFEDFDTDYRDTASFIALCESHINYDKGYMPGAYYEMKEIHFHHLAPEQSKTVDDYVKTLETDYDKYLKKKAESDAEEYRYRITHGVPFVGMPESEIKNTLLGAPSGEVRHNLEMINGKQYTANLYDFKYGSRTVFTARCVKGNVIQVWDGRDRYFSTYKPKKSTTKKQDSDPYDVNDYSNEEDFYDDHYDDFYDYYDAEDYYNEHHE